MRVVLIGAAGTGTAFALASRIRAEWGRNVRLIAVDINPEELVTTSVLADRFIQVPLASDPAFGDRIRDIIRSEAVQTFIPVLSDEQKLAVSLMGEPEFAKLDFWTSSLYVQCADKDFADHWLGAIGLPTPRKLDPFARSIGEAFVKPRAGFGSRGARKMALLDVVALPPAEREGLIVQELCTGPEITVDSFYDDLTATSFAYCRERLEVKSGVCTKARVFSDPQLEEFARTIGKGLGQRGTICFQVMRGQAGWVVTDLNLRSGAGTAITCSAGFDVLAAGFACRLGEDYGRFLRPMDANEEYIVTRQYCEFVMRHRQ